ncbi:anti-sigma-F factor Fin [Pasteuria penetrans]|uniref:anti-sigma-F factor Fin n=1 Tax=Pasteuria penetrans TaxID=86005 RepID=UPI000FA763F9|nr:anti-sigma-F factor Fin [Pasteuria penetrans]
MTQWEYICRHCKRRLGTLVGNIFSDEQLGLDRLTAEERIDIITESAMGGCQVRVVCEDCQQALESNPELSLTPYLFH